MYIPEKNIDIPSTIEDGEIIKKDCGTATESIFIFLFLCYIAYRQLSSASKQFKKRFLALGYFGNIFGLVYGYFIDETIDKFIILYGFLFSSLESIVIFLFTLNKCGVDFYTILTVDIICALFIGVLLILLKKTILKLQKENIIQISNVSYQTI